MKGCSDGKRRPCRFAARAAVAVLLCSPAGQAEAAAIWCAASGDQGTAYVSSVKTTASASKTVLWAMSARFLRTIEARYGVQTQHAGTACRAADSPRAASRQRDVYLVTLRRQDQTVTQVNVF